MLCRLVEAETGEDGRRARFGRMGVDVGETGVDLGDAIGARVELTAAGRTQIGEVRGGGSYLSQNSLRVRFGLGDAKIASVVITWPDGETQSVEGLAVNRVHRIRR